MQGSLTEDWDIGIPLNYVPSSLPESFCFHLAEGLLYSFRKSIQLDMPMTVLLENVRTTTRILVSTGLPLAEWKISVFSLLQSWAEKENFVVNKIYPCQQQISSINFPMSSSQRDEKIQSLEVKVLVTKGRQEKLEVKLRQLSKALEDCTSHLSHLELSLSTEVQAKINEASTRDTLVKLETELEEMTTTQMETYLKACKASLAGLKF